MLCPISLSHISFSGQWLLCHSLVASLLLCFQAVVLHHCKFTEGTLISMLLLMGGAEPNPGPVTEAQKKMIGRLKLQFEVSFVPLQSCLQSSFSV